MYCICILKNFYQIFEMSPLMFIFADTVHVQLTSKFHFELE